MWHKINFTDEHITYNFSTLASRSLMCDRTTACTATANWLPIKLQFCTRAALVERASARSVSHGHGEMGERVVELENQCQ
jgi:hypothetical protein